VDRIQWDVMDGVFVPNSPSALSHRGGAPAQQVGFEAHLMVVNPTSSWGVTSTRLRAGHRACRSLYHLHRTLAHIRDLARAAASR